MARVVLVSLLLATLAISEVFAGISSTHGRKRGFSMRMGRQPHTFVKHPNPMGAYHAMGWKAKARAVPMSGGLYTLGAYYANITVGSGAGRWSAAAIVDTGSSNTAIPSVDCANCGTNYQYNSSASPTARPVLFLDNMCQNCVPVPVGTDSVSGVSPSQDCLFGNPMNVSGVCGFGISYGGSGTATAGTTVRDFACIGNEGDLCANGVYINKFEQQYPTGTQPTGILGLTYPHNACNPSCQPTFMDSLVAEGNLQPDENKFGMCLTKTNGGRIDFGHYDPQYTAAMKWTPVVKEHWFNIEVKDMLVDGISIGVPSFLYNIVNDGIGGFVDSGTSVVLVSPYAMQVLTGLFLSPNTTFSSLPGVSALFGGQCTSLSSSQVAQYPKISFLVRGMEGQPDFHLDMDGSNYLIPGPSAGTYCLGIAGVPSIGVIIGDVMMTNYYIAFDRAGKKLGFAPLGSSSNC